MLRFLHCDVRDIDGERNEEQTRGKSSSNDDIPPHDPQCRAPRFLLLVFFSGWDRGQTRDGGRKNIMCIGSVSTLVKLWGNLHARATPLTTATLC